ncbi:cytidine deaminase [Chitinophaga sp. CF118]|uniref:cytidine deaminase n=1 Tax=Chitinophaga sp. CF118 TaxID=1884367 RepID=UPI0008E67071|nr:cytidine deaminase [Chitinophaga sp. CF118]SFE05413.1 cytidine deaminase [Chitinophaga sp. CF118]
MDFSKQSSFEYLSHPDSSSLSPEDLQLLQEARTVTAQAYAPYSKFNVGAAILLENGALVRGTNQENASFPAGICAERVALSASSSLHPGVAVNTIAVSYHNLNGSSDAPISPCGICRQTLSEYENRQQQPIRLILSGQTGKVFIIQTARHLLPMVFSAEDMK